MHLLLVRHEESVKNVKSMFSSSDDREPLTAAGLERSLCLAKDILAFREKLSLSVKSVYCASSSRSIEMSKAIANFLGVEVISCDGLRSTKAGVLAGRTESEAMTLQPSFIRLLELYRANLFNSYDLPRFEGKEAREDFNTRVKRSLKRILEVSDENLKIVVTHRSPITAILICFARKYYGYPKRFHGYVQLDLGRVSWLYRREDRSWEIKAVNRTMNDLLTRGLLSA